MNQHGTVTPNCMTREDLTRAAAAEFEKRLKAHIAGTGLDDVESHGVIASDAALAVAWAEIARLNTCLAAQPGTVADLTDRLVAASSEWDDNTGDDEGPTSRPYLEHLARAVASWRPTPADAGDAPGYFLAPDADSNAIIWRGTGENDPNCQVVTSKGFQDGEDPVLWSTLVKALTGQDTAGTRVVTICGSMRFFTDMLKVAEEETAAGRIVLAPFSVVAPEDQGGEFKQMLDDLHRRKIDLSSEIVVVTRGGYVGQSTRGEIEYAEQAGKAVRYVESGDSTADEYENCDRTSNCPGRRDEHHHECLANWRTPAELDNGVWPPDDELRYRMEAMRPTSSVPITPGGAS